MYEVSDEYLETVEGDNRYFPTRCKFDGINDYITQEHIRAGTYTDIVDGNNILTMGNACSKKIEMTIGNFDTPYVWKGARFVIEKGLEVNGAIDWVPWGTFWVTDISTPNDNRKLSLTAYDRMYKLSKMKYNTNLVAPFHYCDLLNEFLTNTGMTLNTTAEMPSADDADYMILSWPDKEFTYSDIAGHLAGMVGCNARISTSDPSVLEFVWYVATGTKIESTLYSDGFERLADSELKVDYFVTGSNKEIVIENTDDSNAGELDFRPFDSEDPDDHPWLTFTYDDATLTASVRLTEGYEADTQGIKIPDSLFVNGNIYNVTEVEANGFNGCAAAALVLPYMLTTIGQNAFGGCVNITELTIPETVTSVAWYLVAGCTSLKTIYYNAINATVSSSATSYRTVFGYYANNDNSAVEAIIVGEGVETIPKYFARKCPNLTFTNIPNTVTAIGEGAYRATAISVITIPESVTGLGQGIFTGCTSLKTIYYNALDADMTGTVGSSSAIFGDCGVETVEVALGVTKIPAYLCRYCVSLVSINIPNTVTYIGTLSFSGCTSLPSLTIPRSVTAMYRNIASGCTSLKTVYFNAIAAVMSGTNVSKYSIMNCSAIETVVFGNEVQSLPQYLFRYSTAITSLDIPSNVESIASATFGGCTGITSIVVDKPADSISGSPWGATNATVSWVG